MFPRCCARGKNLPSGSSIQLYVDIPTEQLCGQALALLSLQGSHQPVQEVVVVVCMHHFCLA